jgi:hypothetical protein
MKALNCAYSVLMSPRQRRIHDLASPTTYSEDAQHSAPRAAAASATSGGCSHRDGLFAWKQRREARQCQDGQRSPSPGPNTEPTAADPPAAGGASSTGTRGGVSCAPAVRPRYQSGGKYSSSARQARRMDPAQYTHHIDGRGAEFSTAASAPPSTTPMPTPGPPKPPIWLQRQIDVAKKWEEIHCAADPDEQPYQWANACGTWLDRVKERRQTRESGPVAAAAGC